MPPTLYLIDGHALAYRTYFALTGAGGNTARWTTSKGEPTAGIFGFTSVLLRYLEQDRPDYLMVAFDVGKTFRDDIYPDYKGTREKMPDDLRMQLKRIRELVDTFNIPRLELEGFEADDVIGSVARKAAAQGIGVKIITGDRDLLQLVDKRIIVTLPEGRSLAEARDYTPEDVFERMGVRPNQIVDFKALQGDKSDNIPGVRGIGEKTAAKLLGQYDTLDAVYQNLDEIGGSVGKKLASDRDNAYLSQKLARIVTDLDIPIDLEKARVENFDPHPVQALFHELEFQSLVKRLVTLADSFGKDITSVSPPSRGTQLTMFAEVESSVAGESVQTRNVNFQVTIVNTPDVLARLADELKRAKMIAFDTETTSTDQMQADLVGISLATKPGQGFYIPVGHLSELGSQLPLSVVLETLRGPMTDPDIPKAGHNIKYDAVILARYGLRAFPLSFDTMIAEWLRDPNSRNLGLKKLAWVNLNAQMTEIEALIGKGKNQRTMAEVSINDAAAYAADDAEVVLRLIPGLKSSLIDSHALSLFEDIEMPLVDVLADMEMAGIMLDTTYLNYMSVELNAKMAEIETRVFNAVGEVFNLNSTQQLSTALFDKLGLSPPDRTRKNASGFYSTAASVLETIRDQHQVVDWVLDYREYSKLLSTYVDALPQQVNSDTGRVHTSYNQTGSVTGRIASSDPNLQNIPIRTDLGRRVRRAFIAAPDHVLLAVDYSQVELRIVAHMANDQAMISAFQAGQDIHATTAAAIYGISLNEVTSAQRRHAKAVNFGLIYGMSAFGLTRSTDLTLAESEDFVEMYFKQFPGVKGYLDQVRISAAKKGYVETLLGRRRYFPGLKNRGNPNVRSREEREAINAPIQGTAADIMKIAMIRVAESLKASGHSARMLLQVHDELILECPINEVRDVAQLVQKVMSNAFSLKVPLTTEARSGPNWYEMEIVEI